MDLSFIQTLLDECNEKAGTKEEMLRTMAFGNDILNYEVDLEGTEWAEKYGFYKIKLLGNEDKIQFYVDLYVLRKVKNTGLIQNKYILPVSFDNSLWDNHVMSDFTFEWHIVSQELADKEGIKEFEHTCGRDSTVADNFEYIHYDIEIVGGKHYMGHDMVLDYSDIQHFRNAELYCRRADFGIWNINDYKKRGLTINANNYMFAMHLSKQARKFIMRVFKYLDNMCESNTNSDDSWYPGMVDEFTNELDYVESEEGPTDTEARNLANRLTFCFIVSSGVTNKQVASWMYFHINQLLEAHLGGYTNGYNVEIIFAKVKQKENFGNDLTDGEFNEIVNSSREIAILNKDGEYENYMEDYLGFLESIDGYDYYYCMR